MSEADLLHEAVTLLKNLQRIRYIASCSPATTVHAQQVQQCVTLRLGSKEYCTETIFKIERRGRQNLGTAVRDDGIVTTGRALMINLIERDPCKVSFIVSGYSIPALHIAIAELGPGNGKDSMCIEDEHHEDRCVGFLSEAALTRLSDTLNVKLGWGFGPKIEPDPVVRVRARSIDFARCYVARSRICRVIA